jgi:acetyltransferase
MQVTLMESFRPTADPAHNMLGYKRQPLDAIFAPTTVAVIGATETPGSVGRTILWNLMSNPFGGTIFPVNPKRSSVLGFKAYPKIAEIPEPVDLAVIATPAHTVPAIIQECVDAGVNGAIIISAGFKEIGEQGIELERQIMDYARQGNLRIVGPNCLGVMNPLTGLNATFASAIARPGNVAFISQSGALCTSILDWSFRENVGFSAFVSIGSMLDVDWGDLIYYFGEDPRTKSIVIYMESVGDARSFLSAAREIALSKPIIVIKAGCTEQAAKAAASHTGAIAGSDAVLDAAFRRCGVLRVHSISYLFSMTELLAKQPPPKGPNLTILTNAGGPGVITTDALISQGSELTELAPETIEALNQILPTHWSHNNPIDILGDADPERYAQSLEIAANDPNTDGLLVILTPQSMTEPTQTAEKLKRYAKLKGKPVLASWIGGTEVTAGAEILNQAGIPAFPFPDMAARLFHYMWRYNYNLQGLYETPLRVHKDDQANRFLAGKLAGKIGTIPEQMTGRAYAELVIKTARDTGRTTLTEFESQRVFAAYGIPTVKTLIAMTEDRAVEVAEEIGYPVVVKLYSDSITHKSDISGVRLNLENADEVMSAYRGIKQAVTEKLGAEYFDGVIVQPMIKSQGYELIIGSMVDPQFGPMVVFGAGGVLIHVIDDCAIGLPPLNTTLARRMIEQTKIYKILKGVRGQAPINLEILEQILVRFSYLLVEQPWIKETDINPLLVSPDGFIALDACVILHDQETTEEQLPQSGHSSLSESIYY